MANFIITFILTFVLFSINEAITTYWARGQFAPTLIGLTELVIGVYAGLPIPVAQALIWGGGITSIRDGWRNYDRIKDSWKPIYLIGNFIALFLIWRLAQGVVVSTITEEISETCPVSTYPTINTIDNIGADYPMIIRV
jgi:hypothetical protein